MRNTELKLKCILKIISLEKDFNKKKVDVNVLLNRVRAEKNSEVKKNLIITAGALGTLALTGVIAIL